MKRNDIYGTTPFHPTNREWHQTKIQRNHFNKYLDCTWQMRNVYGYVLYIFIHIIVLCGFPLAWMYMDISNYTLFTDSTEENPLFHWNNKICPFVLKYLSKTKHTLQISIWMHIFLFLFEWPFAALHRTCLCLHFIGIINLNFKVGTKKLIK